MIDDAKLIEWTYQKYDLGLTQEAILERFIRKREARLGVIEADWQARQAKLERLATLTYGPNWQKEGF